MKLYLHIGSPKTGTTAIQAFLAEQSALLIRQGVYVSDVCYANNHIEFAMLPMNFERASRPGAFRRELQLKGIRSEAGFGRWKKKFLQDLRKDLSFAQGKGAQKYLVSSELLFFLTEPEIRVLHYLLKELFSELLVIMFVRDQVSQVESWYSTKVKDGYSGSISDFLESNLNPDGALNWSLLDKNWSSSFGNEKVIVKVHDSQLDVREVFLAACGAQQIVLPERVVNEANPSVSQLEAMLLQLAQKRFKVTGSYFHDMSARRFLANLAILGKFPGDKVRLTAEQRGKLIEAFERSNREIMRARSINLDLEKTIIQSENQLQPVNDRQLNAILDLIEARYLTRLKQLQARVGVLAYVLLVRLRLRPLARSFKRLAKRFLRNRGTPIPMY